MIDPSDINSRQLKIFAAVVDEKSLGKAARRLFLTQPAVSQAIASLEKQLALKLFYRSRRGVVPTRSAEILRDGVLKSEIALASALSEIAELGELKRGALSIAASDTLSLYLLSKPLAIFRKNYSEVELTVKNRPSDEIIEMVMQRESDLGLISLRGKEENVFVTEIDKSKLMLIQSAKVVGNNRELTLKEIAKLDLILLEKSSRIRRLIERAFSNVHPSLNIVMEVSSFEVAKKFVKDGLGASLVPEMALEKGDYKTFNVHKTPAQIPDISYGIITLPEMQDPAIQKFIEIFEKQNH